jgi:hypothetical protein
MSYDLSFDPGTNATGVCIWNAGKLHGDPITLRTPAKEDFSGKFRALKGMIWDLLMDLDQDGGIKRVAIEDFVNIHSNNKFCYSKSPMIKCSTIRGMIMSIALDFTDEVRLVSKNRITKSESAQLAEVYGINIKQPDAIDAFQIGVCAGFDLPNKKRESCA